MVWGAYRTRRTPSNYGFMTMRLSAAASVAQRTAALMARTVRRRRGSPRQRSERIIDARPRARPHRGIALIRKENPTLFSIVQHHCDVVMRLEPSLPPKKTAACHFPQEGKKKKVICAGRWQRKASCSGAVVLNCLIMPEFA